MNAWCPSDPGEISRWFRHLWKLPLVSALPSAVFVKKPMNGTFISEMHRSAEHLEWCFLKMDLYRQPKAVYTGPF